MPLTEYLLCCNHWRTDNHHRDLHKPHILRALQQVSDTVVVWEWWWGHYNLCGFPHVIFTTSRNPCKTVSPRAIFSPPLMLIINGWKGELKSIHISPMQNKNSTSFKFLQQLLILQTYYHEGSRHPGKIKTKAMKIEQRRQGEIQKKSTKSALSCSMGS